jgi:DNA polymerase-3 subunit beta
MNEFGKISSYIEEDSIKIFTEKTKIVFKSSKTTMISRLLDGQFPKYNQLIPTESPKTVVVNVETLTSALERAAIMVNDKTGSVKMEFSDGNLKLYADTPDSGKSEEKVAVEYTGDDLIIAFNYKYILEALKSMDCEEVKIGLNTSLSATVFRPNNNEDFVCLIMPVQIR